MTPRVSIVSTVYDRVDCLQRCLRSVQHLTFQNLEHIVVSDNPPEDVVADIADLCDEFGVQHINMPSRVNDWGRSPAMAGLKASQGEFVCFLSDDNAYLPNHFGPLVEAFDADPGLGFVYSSCLYDGRTELRWCPPVGAGIDLGQPLFRREMLLAHIEEHFPPYVFSWDWELIGTLMWKGVRWQHVDAATFIFRLISYPRILSALA